MTVNPYSTTGSGRTTGSTGAGVSEREDLANFISMITRDETPWMASIGKTKADSIYHEWQTDALEAPGNSRVSDGSDYTSIAPDFGAGTGGFDDGAIGTNSTPDRVRLGNYTQINAKTVAVSGTKRAIDQAGVADEYAYQLKKRGTEMKRDLERHLINDATAVALGSGTRKFGGYQAWIQHPDNAAVVDNGGTGGGRVPKTLAPTGTVKFKNKAGVTTGSAVAAPAATLRGIGTTQINIGSGNRLDSFELEDIDDVMQAIYEAGGKASKVMVSPKNRRVFSAKAQASSGGLIQGGSTGVANVRRNLDSEGSLRQSVDMYMSDFGEIMIEPNYIMGLGVAPDLAGTANLTAFPKDYMALVYDPQWFNIATLRPLQEVDVGQRGDSTVGMILEECSLEVMNPIGCGAVYGLNGS